MIKSSPATSRLKTRQRTPALFGFLALALFQISVASHQFEHLADHGFAVCDICTTSNQFDDAPVPDALPISIPVELHVASITKARRFAVAPTSTAYLSRAPPHS